MYVIPGKEKLHGREKLPYKCLFLVPDVLADAFADIDFGALELNDRERDAIDIEHDVGAFGVFTFDGHFLGNQEVVGLWVKPVDEMDGFRRIRLRAFYFCAVAQKFVGLAVGVVERLTCTKSGGNTNFMEDVYKRQTMYSRHPRSFFASSGLSQIVCE